MLQEDPRFADIAARTANIDALYDMVGEELGSAPPAEWLEDAARGRHPAHGAAHAGDADGGPASAGSRLLPVREHPSEGRIRTMREPSTWSETPPPEGSFAPRLGQHTREILAEAGYTEAEIDAMIAGRRR